MVAPALKNDGTTEDATDALAGDDAAAERWPGLNGLEHMACIAAAVGSDGTEGAWVARRDYR
ncbi:MAG: hypothetical protein QNJ35_15590 [Paracoccaceae bacterium]|nr:hypothetical protein [Paracoccaceae bacterium]